MIRLLDTDVLVDIVRQHQPAVTWIASLDEDEPIGVPGPVALELIEGCKNRQETNRIMRLVNRYPIYWPSSIDGDRALRSFAQHHLAHNLSSYDALIAQCAIGLSATLVTFNVKHFRVIAGLATEQPYQR